MITIAYHVIALIANDSLTVITCCHAPRFVDKASSETNERSIEWEESDHFNLALRHTPNVDAPEDEAQQQTQRAAVGQGRSNTDE